MSLIQKFSHVLDGAEGHIPKQQQYCGSEGALYQTIPKLLSSNSSCDNNLSSCPDEPIQAPHRAILLSPCSSLLAEWCLLHTASASAAERDHTCRGGIRGRRWEKSTTSSQHSSVRTLNKPALRLEDHGQFPVTAELTPLKEFPPRLLAHSPLCLHNNNKPGQWIAQQEWNYVLSLRQSGSPSVPSHSSPPPHTWLSTLHQLWSSVGPDSSQPVSPAEKLQGIKEGKTVLTGELHWLW